MIFRNKIQRGDIATVAKMLGKSKALISMVVSGERTDVDGKVRKSFEALMAKRQELTEVVDQINQGDHA